MERKNVKVINLNETKSIKNSPFWNNLWTLKLDQKINIVNPNINICRWKKHNRVTSKIIFIINKSRV